MMVGVALAYFFVKLFGAITIFMLPILLIRKLIIK